LACPGSIPAAQELDILLAQSRDDDVIEDAVLFLHIAMGHITDFVQNLLRPLAIRPQDFAAILELLPEPGGADLEELIHVAAENAAEHEPLKQRVAFIAGLHQHPVVELQVTELAIEEVLKSLQVGNLECLVRIGHGCRHFLLPLASKRAALNAK